MEKTRFQQLGYETRESFVRYWSEIEPYRKELWKYCNQITGSAWDAEDLYQDTILRLFTSLSALSHRNQPIHPRSFLYRVATNQWIDRCRKNKFRVDEYVDGMSQYTQDEDPIEIRAAFESLIQHLPPRQIAVIVLIDSFKFTAGETSEIIGTTEGAVHALLNRARKNLKNARENESSNHIHKSTENVKVKEIIDQYVSFFNKRDFNNIAQLVAEHAVYSFVTQDSKEYGKDTIMKASHNPEHYQREDLHAYVRELWGKHAIIFAKFSNEGEPLELNNVVTLEVEDNMIVKIKGYFFCPDFMEAAAEEIGIPREKWGYAE